jgi:hypothetical protein
MGRFDRIPEDMMSSPPAQKEGYWPAGSVTYLTVALPGKLARELANNCTLEELPTILNKGFSRYKAEQRWKRKQKGGTR